MAWTKLDWNGFFELKERLKIRNRFRTTLAEGNRLSNPSTVVILSGIRQKILL
jgi:hypothetical protein